MSTLSPIDLVLSELQNVKKTHQGWTARCPCHDDKKNSLSIALGQNENVLLNCFVGCDMEQIVTSLGLHVSDLFPEEKVKREKGKVSLLFETYDYVDEQGQLLFQCCRTKDKQFPQRRPDGKGGWLWNLKEVRLVLYHLPEVLEAIKKEEWLFVVEGEKDVESLREKTFYSTTNPLGASKWRKEYSETLTGAHVVLVPDNDPAGEKHIEQVFESLKDKAASIRILFLPGLSEKEDISDWFQKGHTKKELLELVLSSPVFSEYPDLLTRKIDALPENEPLSQAREIEKLIPLFQHCQPLEQEVYLEKLEQKGVKGKLLQRLRKSIKPQKKKKKEKNDVKKKSNKNTKTRLTADQARMLYNPGRTTHQGNAERLIEQHGKNLHYVPEWDWLAWDGKNWNRNKSVVESYYKKTARQIYFEAAEEDDKSIKEELWKWGKASESQAVMSGSLRMAESEPGIPAKTEDFDTYHYLLNCQNGLLDLQTGQFHKHQREYLITKVLAIDYNPKATCPHFLAFLERILLQEQALIEFVQKFVGYSLTGSVKEQCMAILHGEGQNGKSTLINVLINLMGEYAKRTPTDMLMMKRGDQGIPNDLARLVGTRLVTAVETEDNKRLAEVKIKELTGSDRITARFLHQEFFEFYPQFKLWFATNHKPIIKGTDHAIWRRIRLIPFDVQISEDEKDPDLGEKLKLELPGILNWAVEGCLKWQQDGLQPPEKVIKATNNYREEMDTLAAFLTECCVLSPMATVSAKDLYQTYLSWCEENNEHPEKQKVFGGRLTERGLERYKSSGRWKWYGIGLTSSQSDNLALK